MTKVQCIKTDTQKLIRSVRGGGLHKLQFPVEFLGQDADSKKLCCLNLQPMN